MHGLIFYIYFEIEFYLFKDEWVLGCEFELVDWVGYFDYVLRGMMYDFWWVVIGVLELMGIFVEFSYYEGGFG